MHARPWFRIAAAALMVAGCRNAGEDLPRPTLPTGFVAVGVYLDRDGSHSATPLDTIYPGGRIALLAPGGNDTIRVGVTDATGQVFFDTLPVGTYRVVVDRAALPDSIGTVAPDTATVRVINEVTTTFDSLHEGVVIRFGYPEVTLAQARAMSPGHRVLVHGRVVAPLQDFRDSSAFLIDSSGALRIAGSRPRAGGGNNIGDSVLVLGTTGQLAGQGVLLGGLFSTYSTGLGPLPQIVTVGQAHNAENGALDAVLVQLSNVVIRDTAVSGPDFAVTVADPNDVSTVTTVILDQLLNAPHSLFAIGHTATIRGVLVPIGDGTWVLRPRGPIDIVVN